MEEWENPIYKKIAKSELGSGHTSGIVPVKITQKYFGKPLKEKKHDLPSIVIEFHYKDISKIIKTKVHYFISKTHDHIHLTGNLMPSYKNAGAKEGDFLIFWKSKTTPYLFKAELITKDMSEWENLERDNKKIGGFLKGDYNKKEDESEEKYQEEIIVDEELNDSDFPPIKRPDLKKTTKVNRLPTNKSKGDYVLKKEHYLCEVDKSHKTFVTKNGKDYMEKHHLIPVSYFENFENSLDDINNIICLCPICHRLLHYGDSKIAHPILEKILKKKKDGLIKSKIDINIEKLKKMY